MSKFTEAETNYLFLLISGDKESYPELKLNLMRKVLENKE